MKNKLSTEQTSADNNLEKMDTFELLSNMDTGDKMDSVIFYKAIPCIEKLIGDSY